MNDVPAIPDLRHVRVLVLDDEEPIRLLVQAILVRHGCTVSTAANGHEGLRLLLQRDFDVAVVDLRMRGMAGMTFLAETRGVWPWLGIVILTGHADAASVEQARRQGVTRILEKPMEAQQLLQSVYEEAVEKKQLVDLSAGHSLGHVQEQLALLRRFSEEAIAAESLEHAMRALSLGMSGLLACSVVGILNVQEDEQALYLIVAKPVAPEFALAVKNDMLRRYEALTGRARPRDSLRVLFDPTACIESGPRTIGSQFSVPIVTEGEVRGLLTLAASAPDAYSSRDAAFLYHAATHLSTVLTALAHMRQLAVRDVLTGLYNRRGLEEDFQRTWILSRRYGWPIGVAVIDIDGFKNLNDTHGHLAGDEILREFGSLIQRAARDSDIIGRYGGDEVVVILPQAGAADCIVFGERLLHALRQHVFCQKSLGGIKLTASVGVATSHSAPRELASMQLLAQADYALYMAKKQGRDRVSIYQPDPQGRADGAPPDKPAPGEARTLGRVLVVDDDPAVGPLLARILRKSGYEVSVETSASGALAAIQHAPGSFDVILTDLNLPGKSGLELLDELRSIDESMIKIVITGHATLDNAVTSLRRGAYDFIQKPLLPEQLTAVLERALEYRRLKIENVRYQNRLEEMVREKSAALREALEQVKTSYSFTLEAMAGLLDARERSTAHHSTRVRDLAIILAREIGLSISEIEDIARAALLHDIGKIGIPDSVLLKPGPLTPEERTIMHTHPEVGYQLLRSSAYLERVAEIVRSHHEHFDGSGYPRGLRGPDICLGARIFSVIDAYDAMRSDRVYRKALAPEAALAEIAGHAGTQFDPAVVEAFRRCHRSMEAVGAWGTLLP